MTYSEILKVSLQLEKDLVNLDFEALPIHEGVKSYYRFDLTKIRYVSECNAFILFHILKDVTKKLSETLIIDHGAGLGFFSFLVKRLGMQCICHDISTEYIEGIKIIGKELYSLPDHFVTGDTDILIKYFQINSLEPDGLGSRNVIEHIPDYKQFFNELNLLSKPGFAAVITTSANMHNPLVKKIHLKIHDQFENVGILTDMDNPILNTSNCGMKMRSELIRKHVPELDEKTNQILTKLNRGFVKQEIIDRVNNYLLTGQFPAPHPDPSNTRDPITGAWVERLVAYTDYKKAAESSSFQFEVIPGFYNTHYKFTIKNVVSRLLNFILKINSPWSVNLSPFLAMKLKKK